MNIIYIIKPTLWNREVAYNIIRGILEERIETEFKGTLIID